MQDERKHGRQETQEQKSMIKHTATIEHEREYAKL